MELRREGGKRQRIIKEMLDWPHVHALELSPLVFPPTLPPPLAPMLSCLRLSKILLSRRAGYGTERRQLKAKRWSQWWAGAREGARSFVVMTRGRPPAPVQRYYYTVDSSAAAASALHGQSQGPGAPATPGTRPRYPGTRPPAHATLRWAGGCRKVELSLKGDAALANTKPVGSPAA